MGFGRLVEYHLFTNDVSFLSLFKTQAHLWSLKDTSFLFVGSFVFLAYLLFAFFLTFGSILWMHSQLYVLTFNIVLGF